MVVAASEGNWRSDDSKSLEVLAQGDWIGIRPLELFVFYETLVSVLTLLPKEILTNNTSFV